jgi:hypothetical protein
LNKFKRNHKKPVECGEKCRSKNKTLPAKPVKAVAAMDLAEEDFEEMDLVEEDFEEMDLAEEDFEEMDLALNAQDVNAEVHKEVGRVLESRHEKEKRGLRLEIARLRMLCGEKCKKKPAQPKVPVACGEKCRSKNKTLPAQPKVPVACGEKCRSKNKTLPAQPVKAVAAMDLAEEDFEEMDLTLTAEDKKSVDAAVGRDLHKRREEKLNRLVEKLRKQCGEKCKKKPAQPKVPVACGEKCRSKNKTLPAQPKVPVACGEKCRSKNKTLPAQPVKAVAAMDLAEEDFEEMDLVEPSTFQNIIAMLM